MGDRGFTWKQRGALWLRIGIRLTAVLAAVWLWRRIGRKFLALTSPFLLAWIFAFVLDAPVRWWQKRAGFSRKGAALSLILLLLILIGGGVWLIFYYAGHELMELARNWDGLLVGIQNTRESLTNLFARIFALIPPELTQMVDGAINTALLWAEQTIPTVLKGVGAQTAERFKGLPAFGAALFVFVMGTYFITADYPALCRRMTKGMSRTRLERMQHMKHTVFTAFGGYLKAQLVLSFGVFCILLLGFLLTGQSYSLLLAFALALVDFIPLLGAGLIMIPWAGFALLSRAYTKATVIMVIWGVISLYRRLAEPKVVGEQTGLSPILSLFSIYVGMKVAGVAGMILAPVIALAASNLIQSGVFDDAAGDLRAAARDLSAILKQK